MLLTATAECYHVGHADPFRESIRRLQAYAEAGADVLFAPGPHTAEEIKAHVNAVRPGSFAGLAGLAPFAEINDLLAADLRRRQAPGF